MSIYGVSQLGHPRFNIQLDVEKIDVPSENLSKINAAFVVLQEHSNTVL